MEECGICYYEVATEKFHDLTCCENHNRMCTYCLELLLVPLCPFCRTRIPGLPEKNEFRGAVSLDTYTLLPPMYALNPLDDSYLDSRILRRQMKRLRKLQERDRNASENRRTNYLLNERKKRDQQQKRDDIAEEIKEGLETFRRVASEEGIFDMDG